MRFFGDLASIADLTAAMNAFLSKPPGRWASIVSTLAALAWPSTSPDGGTAASCASLAFAAAGGCAFFSRPWAFTAAVTPVNPGSSSGRVRDGGVGGASTSGSAAATGPGPAAAGAGARPGGPAAFRAGRDAAASGDFAGVRFGGGTGFLPGTAPGPKPVFTTFRADAGGFRS